MSNPSHSGLRPGWRVGILLLFLSPLGLAIPALVWNDPPSKTAETAENSPSPRPDGTRLTVQNARPILGFAISAHHISTLDRYLDSVDRIAELGANSLIVISPMFQDRVDSSTIRYQPEKCASPEQLTAILQRARFHGLHTTLLPIVLIENAEEKEWRGVIQPEDWDAWWESYDRFIEHFLNVAIEAEVDLFGIGSELNSTENQMDRWKRIVDIVRDQYHGQIMYSANWDRYEKVTLWPMVDIICVSAYFELLRDRNDVTVDELAEAWTSERDRLIEFAREWDKPLLLSEIGYPSLATASAHPWNYVAEPTTEADHEAQSRSWKAFFRAWSVTLIDPSQPTAGFFIYHWSPYHKGDRFDTGYGVAGKPAYEIIRKGFTQIRDKSGRKAP